MHRPAMMAKMLLMLVVMLLVPWPNALPGPAARGMWVLLLVAIAAVACGRPPRLRLGLKLHKNGGCGAARQDVKDVVLLAGIQLHC